MWENAKKLWEALSGFRTIALHLITGMWAFLEAFNFTAFVEDPKTLALVVLGVNVIGVALRLITNGPVPGVGTAEKVSDPTKDAG
ncbi:hypothetical protein ACJ4V0_15505 [Phreatobacter sp. HK31-P]